jgi:hypothetical protein
VTAPGRFFAYDVDPRFAPLLRLLGFRPSRDGVLLTPDEFVATFGLFRLATPASNLREAHVTRDHGWWQAIGARRSPTDDSFAFGTSARGGVCIHFHTRVPSPLKRTGRSALTVTVTDLAGLVAAVGEAARATAATGTAEG